MTELKHDGLALKRVGIIIQLECHFPLPQHSYRCFYFGLVFIGVRRQTYVFRRIVVSDGARNGFYMVENYLKFIERPLQNYVIVTFHFIVWWIFVIDAAAAWRPLIRIAL